MDYKRIDCTTIQSCMNSKKFDIGEPFFDYRLNVMKDSYGKKGQLNTAHCSGHEDERSKGVKTYYFWFNIKYKGESYSIKKRFSDFVKLREDLRMNERRHIVPILLEKGNLFEKIYSFNEDYTYNFLSNRKEHLEYFLYKVLFHESLRESDIFKNFLEDKDQSLDQSQGGIFSSVWGGVSKITTSIGKNITGTVENYKILTSYVGSSTIFESEIKEFTKLSSTLKVILNFIEANKEFYESKYEFEKDCVSDFQSEVDDNKLSKSKYKDERKQIYRSLDDSSMGAVGKAEKLNKILILAKQVKADIDCVLESVKLLKHRISLNEALYKKYAKEKDQNANSMSGRELKNQYEAENVEITITEKYYTYEITKIKEATTHNIKYIFKEMTETLNKVKF